VANLAITVDEEKVKRARTLWAGGSGSLTEYVPHGLFVEGIESPFA
jgi:hypothetical protein